MGGTTTTTSGSSQPWDAAQPGLKNVIGDATSLYKSGQGSQPFGGSMVTPFAKQTMAGMDGLMTQAQGSQNYMDGSQKALQPYAGGQNMGGMDNEMIGNYAKGNFLDGSQNPNFQNVISRTQQDATNAGNNVAAEQGRYGGATHQGEIARQVGDVTSRMLSNQYNTEVGNMFRGQGQVDARQQMDFGQMMQGQKGMANNYQASMAPWQTMAQVGSGYEDLYTRQLNDSARIHQENQMAPWNQLQMANAIFSGAGSLGKQGTQSSYKPTDWLGLAGNVASSAAGAPGMWG